MGAQGTATLDFTTTVGTIEATVAVTGQTAIDSTTNIAEAWLLLTATADHDTDEIELDPVHVRAGPITTGTGFTIYGRSIEGEHSGTYKVGWVWN